MQVAHDHGSACAVAPADQARAVDGEAIHHCKDIPRHQLVAEGSAVAGTATVAAAVDQDDAIAGGDESGCLEAPVAGMAQATMQQDDGPATADAGEPDFGAVMAYMAGMVGSG